MSDRRFIDEEDPDYPGWRQWALDDPTRFNTLLGPIRFRREDGYVRVRMVPERSHSNLNDHVHGGALLAFIDIALFAASRGFDVAGVGTAVTLDLNTQFIAGARTGTPIDARVELLRETGRLLFLRGLVVQGADEATIAAFSGTIRKPSR